MQMDDFEFSVHARVMIAEREIPEGWVRRTLVQPDQVELRPDRTTHYIKSIDEYENRILRVIVNKDVTPHRIITVFFDRRLR